MKLNELNFIIIVDGIETEFEFPEKAGFRHFNRAEHALSYSIIPASRFIEFRIPLEKKLDFLNKIEYTKKIDKVIILNRLTREIYLEIGGKEKNEELGYAAISIMSDNYSNVEEIMTIPYLESEEKVGSQEFEEVGSQENEKVGE